MYQKKKCCLDRRKLHISLLPGCLSNNDTLSSGMLTAREQPRPVTWFISIPPPLPFSSVHLLAVPRSLTQSSITGPTFRAVHSVCVYEGGGGLRSDRLRKVEKESAYPTRGPNLHQFIKRHTMTGGFQRKKKNAIGARSAASRAWEVIQARILLNQSKHKGHTIFKRH